MGLEHRYRQDKLKFYQKCKHKFNLPYTSSKSLDLHYPMFCKPKKGSGSRGVKVCYDDNCMPKTAEEAKN